jgi:tetratricopeptide (TPR) repeat protein
MELLRRILRLPPGRAESERLVQHVTTLNAQKQSLLDGGDYAAALRIQEECISILDRLWSVHDVGRAYNNAGRMCEELGQWRRALHYFRKGLKQWKRLHETRGQAVARAGIGRVLMQVDEVDRAAEELELARELFYKYNDDNGVAHVLQLLVDAYDRLTLPYVESARARELLEVCRRLSDKELEAHALHLFGNVERKMERLDVSLESLKQARCAYEELKDEKECVNVLQDMAATYRAQGLNTEASEALEVVLRFWKEKGEPFPQGFIHNQLGNVLTLAGDYKQAEEHYAEALDLMPSVPADKRAQAEGMVFYNLADLRRRQKQYKEAIYFADRADEIFSDCNDFPASLMALQLRKRISEEEEVR